MITTDIVSAFSATDSSGINDPFKKEFLRELIMYMGRRSDGTTSIWAKIEFVNGQTVGQQKFEAKSLDELLGQIRVFLNNFSNKRP